MRTQGYTLVELIVVIIILGIIAVVAAPKFLSIDSDAKIATLKGYKGALESAFTAFKAKTYMPSADITVVQVEGDNPLQYLNIDGHKIRFTDDDHAPEFALVPNPNKDHLSLRQLQAIINIDVTEPDGDGKFKISFWAHDRTGFYIYPNSNDIGLSFDTSQKCYLEYKPNGLGHNKELPAQFNLFIDDC